MASIAEIVAALVTDIARDPTPNRNYRGWLRERAPAMNAVARLQVANELRGMMARIQQAATTAAAEIEPAPSELRTGPTWRDYDDSCRRFLEGRK